MHIAAATLVGEQQEVFDAHAGLQSFAGTHGCVATYSFVLAAKRVPFSEARARANCASTIVRAARPAHVSRADRQYRHTHTVGVLQTGKERTIGVFCDCVRRGRQQDTSLREVRSGIFC